MVLVRDLLESLAPGALPRLIATHRCGKASVLGGALRFALGRLPSLAPSGSRDTFGGWVLRLLATASPNTSSAHARRTNWLVRRNRSSAQVDEHYCEVAVAGGWARGDHDHSTAVGRHYHEARARAESDLLHNRAV